MQHFQSTSSTGHVALTACQSSELAKELIIGDEHRGAFTATMIEVLETVGDKADYRSVIAAVRSRLERTVERQRPGVHPLDAGGLGDRRFLDGTIEPAPPSFLMTKSESGWSVDAGAVHGLRAPADGEEFRFACLQPDGTPCGQVRVVAVESGQAAGGADGLGAGRHRVPSGDLVGAASDGNRHVRRRRGRCRRTPPTTRFVRCWRRAARQVRRRRMCASGSPVSPPGGLALRVRFEDDEPGGPCLRVLRADGSPAIPTAASAVACGDPVRAAPTVVQQLEHVARWEQLRELGSHRSALADAVQLRIYPAGPGEAALPSDRDPYAPAGEYTIPYGTDGEAPNVFMHLKNTLRP